MDQETNGHIIELSLSESELLKQFLEFIRMHKYGEWSITINTDNKGVTRLLILETSKFTYKLTING